MRQAVIVSAARTGLAKSFRGSFNMTHGATMGGHAVKAAVERAGLDGGEIEDCVIGCGFPEGETGANIGRQIAIRAGLPVTASGMTVNRFCSSGLQSIAIAANAITQEGAGPMVAGGVESISMVQPKARSAREPWIEEHKPAIYMTMIETADIVAYRYNLSREYQDEYALRSQQLIAKAQAEGKFDHEIVPMTTTMAVKDKETGEISHREVVVDRDECNRPSTTLEGLAGLEPVRGSGNFVTAGNASQLSDGAAAVVVMEAAEAERRGLEPLGAFKGFAVAGCEPDEMGIGPVFAVPRLLERHGLKVDDIDLWELNEAFASQCLYS
ncbi:acetyl-CoA C-acyltransferase, partial [Cribrihabitans sp. XS_ASV171]